MGLALGVCAARRVNCGAAFLCRKAEAGQVRLREGQVSKGQTRRLFFGVAACGCSLILSEKAPMSCAPCARIALYSSVNFCRIARRTFHSFSLENCLSKNLASRGLRGLILAAGLAKVRDSIFVCVSPRATVAILTLFEVQGNALRRVFMEGGRKAVRGKNFIKIWAPNPIGMQQRQERLILV